MDGTFTILLFPLTGLLFIGLGIPLKRRMVPPNIWYGFRTPKTLSNEEIWYEINCIAGADMIKAGTALVVSSMLVLSLRGWLDQETAITVLLGVTLASVAAVAIHGFSRLRDM